MTAPSHAPLTRGDLFFCALGSGMVFFVTGCVVRDHLESSSRGLAVFIAAGAGAVAYWFARRILEVLMTNATHSTDEEHRRGSVEVRLDELELLKRRDMVTPEEYAAKRQEILKDL